MHHYISFDIHCNHYTINQQCLNVLTLSIISIFISILLVTLRLTYCSHLSLHQQSHRISYIHFLFSHPAFSSKKKKKKCNIRDTQNISRTIKLESKDFDTSSLVAGNSLKQKPLTHIIQTIDNTIIIDDRDEQNSSSLVINNQIVADIRSDVEEDRSSNIIPNNYNDSISSSPPSTPSTKQSSILQHLYPSPKKNNISTHFSCRTIPSIALLNTSSSKKDKSNLSLFSLKPGDGDIDLHIHTFCNSTDNSSNSPANCLCKITKLLNSNFSPQQNNNMSHNKSINDTAHVLVRL